MKAQLVHMLVRKAHFLLQLVYRQQQPLLELIRLLWGMWLHQHLHLQL